MRKARVQSNTDIYHVMIQGVNKHLLFEDNEDRDYFICVMKKVKIKYSFELYAYCLMDNHVHFLIKATKPDLADIMKSIQVRYYHWFHKKYDYEGHLFNGRYKSIPVESQPYFQKLISYIHINPVKAGMCKSSIDYNYSSIRDYEYYSIDLVSVDKGLLIFGTSDVKQILDYIVNESDFVCMDVKEKLFSDNDAIAKIKSILHNLSASEFSKLKGETLKKALKAIKDVGITIAQLRRFTGMPFAVLNMQWQTV